MIRRPRIHAVDYGTTAGGGSTTATANTHTKRIPHPQVNRADPEEPLRGSTGSARVVEKHRTCVSVTTGTKSDRLRR